jgi:hypothetical protein
LELSKLQPRRRPPNGRDNPAAPAHDRGHAGAQPVAGNTALLRARRCQIRPPFQPITRPARARGIRAYQIHLTTTGISWAGFNVAVCALRFFYGVTLGRTAMVERIPYARKPTIAGDPERR